MSEEKADAGFEESAPFVLEFLNYVGGSVPPRLAVVMMRVRGRSRTETRSSENGPIAAAIAAINAMVPNSLVFENMFVRSAGIGVDAKAEATVKLARDGCEPQWGIGEDSDTIKAAVLAYIAALNKFRERL